VSCRDDRVVREGAEDCFVGLWDIYVYVCISYIVYSSGPKILPWWTPERIGNGGGGKCRCCILSRNVYFVSMIVGD